MKLKKSFSGRWESNPGKFLKKGRKIEIEGNCMAFDRFGQYFPDMAALPYFSSSDKAIQYFLVATLAVFNCGLLKCVTGAKRHAHTHATLSFNGIILYYSRSHRGYPMGCMSSAHFDIRPKGTLGHIFKFYIMAYDRTAWSNNKRVPQ